MREPHTAEYRLFPESAADKKLAMLAYVLHLCAVFTLFSSVAGVVINYIKRDETAPRYAPHHRWMIRTFWWAVFWLAIGFPLLLVGIGWLILFGLAIWWIYRHVRGLVALIDGKPLPIEAGYRA